MKKIILIIGVLLCTTSIIAVISSAQVPRAALVLQHVGTSWRATFGIVELRFPVGSLTLTPYIGIPYSVVSHGLQDLWFGTTASTHIQLLQLKMVYVCAMTSVLGRPFFHAFATSSAHIAAGVGWSANSFLDIEAGIYSSTRLNRARMIPFRIYAEMRISWPLF